MKKQYLLALIAAPFFCAASVNAQGNKPLLKGGNEVTAGLSLNSIQTKAETNALPDSIIFEKNGNVSKSVYKYDDRGRNSERIVWQGTPFTLYEKDTWEYTERGMIVTFSFWDGKEWNWQIKEISDYDEQGREISFELVTAEGIGWKQHQRRKNEYSGNKVYTAYQDTIWWDETASQYDQVNVQSITRTLDERGNYISEEYRDEVRKYMSQQVQMEYNAENQMIGKMIVQYNQEGKEVARYRETWTWKGNTDAYDFMEVSKDGGTTWAFYTEYKAETTGENPVIVTRATNMKSKEDPEWVIEKLTYYYPNSSTANESIESEAAVRIYTQEGSIVVNTENAEPVAVYSITGKCYYNATATGMTTINNLQAGIYIVRVGDKTLKVRVR